MEWLDNAKRCFKLLKNYWIVLALVCVSFLILPVTVKANVPASTEIPGGWLTFLKSIPLFHLYTGIWWYLRAYIVLLLIPSCISIKWLEKVPLFVGGAACIAIDVVWYLIGKLGYLPPITQCCIPITLLHTLFYDVINILPYFWMGALLCKHQVISRLDSYLDARMAQRARNQCILCIMGLLFVGSNLIHKAVLMGPIAVCFFLLFNLWQKPVFIAKLFKFLGRHSTNIWLLHPFFYAERFGALVVVAKYPILILTMLFLSCIFSSIIVQEMSSAIDWLCLRKKCA